MRSPSIPALPVIDEPHIDKRRHEMTKPDPLPKTFDDCVHARRSKRLIPILQLRFPIIRLKTSKRLFNKSNFCRIGACVRTAEEDPFSTYAARCKRRPYVENVSQCRSGFIPRFFILLV